MTTGDLSRIILSVSAPSDETNTTVATQTQAWLVRTAIIIDNDWGECLLSRAWLIIHPVRIRIVQALIPDRRLTVRDLAGVLPDIPQASLYRHLNELVAGDIVVQVDERRVRGTVERIYALSSERALLTNPDVAEFSHEEHRQLFTTFIAGILGDFERYLERDVIDPEGDGLGYRQTALYMSDAEFRHLAEGINALIADATKNQPLPGRTRRLVTTIVMPAEPAPREPVNGDGTDDCTKE